MDATVRPTYARAGLNYWVEPPPFVTPPPMPAGIEAWGQRIAARASARSRQAPATMPEDAGRAAIVRTACDGALGDGDASSTPTSIVVGSGALGANAAYELARPGKSVIILEAGVRIPRWKIVENYRNSSKKRNYNAPYPNEGLGAYLLRRGAISTTPASFEFRPGMLKLVGGTTWHWAAASLALHPERHEAASSTYGVGRDWPIDYDDLEPWYGLAEVALGVAGTGEEDQSGQGGDPSRRARPPTRSTPEGKTYLFQRLQTRLRESGYNFIHEPNARVTAPYDGRPACAGNNNCMPVCPIGAMYSGNVHVEHAEKAGAELRTDATAYRLEKGEAGRIAAVHYRTLKAATTCG